MRPNGSLLVLAPHPDDEVLGAGGTIARAAAEGREVVVAIVTACDDAIIPGYSLDEGRAEAQRAHDLLGIRKAIFFNEFPAAHLDRVPIADLSAALTELVASVQPSLLLIPFPGDLHRDHRIVAEAGLVAARPDGSVPAVPSVWAYETVSETNWYAAPHTPAFHPTAFVEIGPFLQAKLDAMAEYRSQLKPFPHERSLEALRALAVRRGATVGATAAEAFVQIRDVVPLPPP